MVGPPYRVVLRLCAIAADRWAEVDAAYPSIDLIRLPIDRFCNFVYTWCIKYVDPKAFEEWKMALTAPLPWESEPGTPRVMWTDEDEAAAWANASVSLGG